MPITPSPACDPFIGLGAWKMRLDRLFGDLGSPPLLVKEFAGIHRVFIGDVPVGRLRFADAGPVEAVGKVPDERPTHIFLKTVRSGIFRLHEKVSLSFLKRFRDRYDYFYVPWSGGKDSTAALHLAIRAYGVKRVRAVFVDTGTEFEENLGYVEVLSRRLGVQLERVEAGLDRLIREMGLPTNRNRWCTKVKISALRRGILGLGGNFVTVVGDRDAESPLRSRRPPYRSEEVYMQLAPLKFWGMIHVQAYLTYYNIPHNPLYLKGFYRIGCVMCPAMRNWELEAIYSDPSLKLQYKSLVEPLRQAL